MCSGCWETWAELAGRGAIFQSNWLPGISSRESLPGCGLSSDSALDPWRSTVRRWQMNNTNQSLDLLFLDINCINISNPSCSLHFNSEGRFLWLQGCGLAPLLNGGRKSWRRSGQCVLVVYNFVTFIFRKTHAETHSRKEKERGKK